MNSKVPHISNQFGRYGILKNILGKITAKNAG